jgi:hypothetical protein
VTKGYV